MVVKLLNVHLPRYLATDSPMVNLNRKISTVIEAPKLCFQHRSSENGTSTWGRLLVIRGANTGREAEAVRILLVEKTWAR